MLSKSPPKPFIPLVPAFEPAAFFVEKERTTDGPLEIAAEHGREMDDTRNRATLALEGGPLPPAAPSWTHLSCQRPKILRGNEHVGEDNGLGV